MSYKEICAMTATEIVDHIRNRNLSALEVMQAHLRQIHEINPSVNAIVTLLADEAVEQAKFVDERLTKGQSVAPLLGIPVAHKDLVPTKGIRTTFGSPIYKDHIPEMDGLIVERLRKAGAITIGKTNTPEFGAGANTYNRVFGETLNPYDLTKTCGGSSGGAAVALACRMLPMADGSDHAGSLRHPANFCNVVGFRPSPGRVPIWPSEVGWYPFAVQGPMARTVRDIVLMLRAISGPDSRCPLSIPDTGHYFEQDLDRDFKGTRIAWSPNLGGLPVDPAVMAVLEKNRHVFEDMGCIVENAEPDFSDADEIFKVWRAWFYEVYYGELLSSHRNQLKETVRWNIEEGKKLTGPNIGRMEKKRTALYNRVHEFMETYEFLILPVTQVPPFDVKVRYIEEINGERMKTYIDWMKSCYYISVTCQPAISVPCGFTSDGLPVGLQIVGRYQDDFGVLQLAHAFERRTKHWKTLPPLLEI